LNKKRLIFLIPLLIIVVVSLIFSGCTASVSEEEPIKIGVLLPLTGMQADLGQLMKEGLMASFQVFLDNDGGKIAGRTVELVIEDDATDPAVTGEKTRKLIESDKVCMILGPLFPPCRVAAAEKCDAAQVPHIGFASHHKPIQESTEWAFGSATYSPTLTYCSGVDAYNRGYRTAVVSAPDIVAAYEYTGTAMQAFKDAGGTIVQEQWIPYGTVDYGPYLVKMQQADVAFVWHPGIEFKPFLTQYEEFGFIGKMPMMQAPFDDFLERDLPGLSTALAGTFGNMSYHSSIDNPVNKKFVEVFEGMYNVPPDTFSLHSGNAVYLAIGALKDANGNTDGETLRQAILNFEGEFPVGHVEMDPVERCLTRDIFVGECRIVDGKLVTVVTGTYSQVKPWFNIEDADRSACK